MLHPASIRAGHLMWTRQGTCWAIWQLQGMSYGMRPHREKNAARLAHQAMFRVLTGESMLLSVVVAQDPVSVVQRMIDGIDLEDREAWAVEAEARLDDLEGTEAGDRLYFLAVPLPNSGLRKFTLPAQAGVQRMKVKLGLPHHGVSKDELKYRGEQAARIEAMIPRTFAPQRASVAQQVWLDYHLMYRGFDATAYSREDLEAVTQVRHVGEPIIDEGGQSDEKGRVAKLNPFAHRYVKIGDEGMFAEGMASYQAMFSLTGMPDGGLLWPGSEILGDVDNYIPGADWVMRMRTRSSDNAKRANATAMSRINDQLDQREHEVGTGLHDLDAAVEAVTAYDQALASDPNEVEIQPIVIFAVCSDSAPDVVQRSRTAVKVLQDEGFSVGFPAGYQQEMWWSFVPGSALTPKINEYAQIVTSRDLAGLVPITASTLGDATGALFAENQTSALLSYVHLDLPNMPKLRNKSACVGVTGELGSGKSMTMKILMKSIVDRDGGQIIATDRSEIGEWVTFVQTLTSPTVIDMTEPVFSLDPLRAFDASRGATIASNFLITLLDLDPTSGEGVLLGEVLTPEYLHDHNITGLGALLAHLTQLGKQDDQDEAKKLSGQMAVYAKKDFARALFDDELPPLPWKTSSAIVIRTNRIEVPKTTELQNAHLYKVMRIEKRFGRAIYTLISSLARMICFDDQSRFAAYFEDEAHMVTSNDLSVADLTLFIRDGRKHNAALILGSHDPEHDFGDETMRGLIPIRIVHRQEDEALAKRSLRWLGLDAEDEELVKELQTNTSPQVGNEVPPERRGEAWMRDATGTIGRVRTLMPAGAASREAASTTPHAGVTDA
ncbi:ATP-binding protein [Brachybacterium sp. J144]|uniref:ATP-binding protein n=1 Tax=Brachybacterium sp. J144 TaxID=3116487 RepID=UPI002E77B688|nr:ATP-binding protein [Brachybacterium sp. J144]MEE1652133.1 ATP-binding protein [Brachybacterium sp. J144]